MNKQILRLAIPNIISNLSIPLLSMVDTALMGHLDDVYYLGAIAIGGTIFNFIYWGFGFLRMGTTGITAQAYGNKDKPAATATLARALLVAIAAAFVLLVLQIPIAWISFYLIEASENVEIYANSYFMIRIWAAPATLALYALHGWFLGMQNAKYPLYLTVFVNAINIILSYMLVFVFQMKSDGVAYGTVFAQYFGLLLAVFLLYRKYKKQLVVNHDLLSGIKNLKAFRRFLAVNGDIFIRTLCLVFVFTYFMAKSAEFGDEILGINSILFQLWMFLAHFIDGFAFATESLVGKFIGARKEKGLRDVVKLSFIWATAIGLFIAAIYYVFAEQILFIFTNSEQLVPLALNFMGWVIIAPLINGFCFIWDGAFIGATDSKPMRNSMIFCTIFIFMPFYFYFEPILGNHSLWLALSLFMVFRGITLTLYARKRMPQWILTFHPQAAQ